MFRVFRTVAASPDPNPPDYQAFAAKLRKAGDFLLVPRSLAGGVGGPAAALVCTNLLHLGCTAGRCDPVGWQPLAIRHAARTAGISEGEVEAALRRLVCRQLVELRT